MVDERKPDISRPLEAVGPSDRAQDALGTHDALAPAFLRDIDKDDVTRRQGRYLPHWTADGAVYHVRFSLADSVPGKVRRELREEKTRLLAVIERGQGALTRYDRKKMMRLYTEKVERVLDAGYGSCWMRQEGIAELVANALRFFEERRYRLYAWCVMPNHVHAVVQPLKGRELSSIVHSWKSYTANKANELLGRHGQFWGSEYFDRMMRDEDEFRRALDYVYSNPEGAGLGDWTWRFRSLEPAGSDPILKLKIQERPCLGE